MRAIILAAGQGTRLRPHTDDRPKCLVPFAGRPLLHWQLEVLRASGITDIALVGGYRADQLEIPGTVLFTNDAYARTNMVATLFCAKDYMAAGEDLLICYGDIVYESAVLEAILECTAEICLSADRKWRRLWELRMDDPLSDAETFEMGDSNQVLSLGKKPRSYSEVQAQYMGLIRVRGDKVAPFIDFYESMDRNADYDGKDFPNMYMTSYLQQLIDANWEVQACLVDNRWLEIDTNEELEVYSKSVADGSLAPIIDMSSIGE